MGQSQDVAPIGLVVAGIVFIGASVAEYSTIPNVWILTLVGIALFVAGVIGFIKEM